ncbi:unnamed protein product, partial [Rotaria magnacalcarata]
MMSRAKCFFDIKIDGTEAGRIVFELYDDICPRTCENFRCLCTGEKGRSSTLCKKLYYKGCLFHRVVKNSMVQSGDFSEGNGTGGESIYGGLFDDESLKLKHDRPYLLSMANRGPNTNGSQFFITTAEASHLDGKHVIFGHVISGASVVATIESLLTDPNTNRPLKDVVISHCGQVEVVTKNAKSKKRKISTGDESDNENQEENDDDDDDGESSSISDKDVKKKKSKHNKKNKKKEKHRRRRESKRLATKTSENKNDDMENNVNDISERDTAGDVDEISEKKSSLRSGINDKDKTSNEDTSERLSRTNNYRSAKKVDSNGRPVKGRGIMRYTGKSRSRSRTPPHWRSAAEERKRFVEMNESREQTNSNENTDAVTQTSEQSNTRESSKRTHSFLKNGDAGDDQENTATNNEEQLTKESTKRSRRHEKRRENVDDENEAQVQQSQPSIHSSVVRAEPKEREQRRSSPSTRQRREHRNESKHHRPTNNKHDENDKHTQHNASPLRSKRDHDESHTNRRHRSQTPPPVSSSRNRSPANDSKHESIEDFSTALSSKNDQQDDIAYIVPTSHSSSPPLQSSSTSSGKRRNRWDKEGELNERQIATEQDHFEDELRMIAQTSTASNESTTKSNVIPQQS